MGGCSSKPQTAEGEGIMDHPPTKQEIDLLFSSLQHTMGPSNPSPYKGSQHTLKNLFIQHGRDSDDDTQTLHDLLFHAVDPKSLSSFENPSAGNAEAHLSSFPAIPNSTQENAEKCVKVEGCLPTLAEETEENCHTLEGAISNSAEEDADKCAKLGVVKNSDFAEENAKLESVIESNLAHKGAQLKDAVSNSAEDYVGKYAKSEGAISNLVEDNAGNCAESRGVISNLAEENAKLGSVISTLAGENADKCVELGGVISNLAGQNADRCAELGGVISNLAGEDAGKCANLEAESSSRGADLEPKSDLKPISELDFVEIGGFELEPKSDCLKISELNLSESIITEVFYEIKASEAMESEAAELQSFYEIAVEAKEAKVHSEKAMGGEETKKATEAEEAEEGKETEFHAEEAMEGEMIEKAMEVEGTQEAMEFEETQIHCEKAMQIEKNEKAVEGELTQASGAKSQAPGKTAIKCNTLHEKAEAQAEKAMGAENTGVQDEKAMASERPVVQDETAFDGENKNVQEHGKGEAEDKNTTCVMALGPVQDSEKAELQNKKQAGVRDNETGVQDEGVFYGEKAKVVHVDNAGTVEDVGKTELRREKRTGVQDEETGVQREKTEVHFERAGAQDDRVFNGDNAKVLCVEKTVTPQDGKNAELQHEKRAGVEDKKTGVQHGVQSEETGVRSEKGGVQDDRLSDGEKTNMVCVESTWTVQEGEKAELQQAKRTGVQDEETGLQSEKTGVQEERIVKAKMQDEEHAEDEKAMVEDVSPSHVKHLFAFTSEATCSEHSVSDACTNPLGRCTELPMLATPCELVLGLTPKKKTTEKLEPEQKKTGIIEIEKIKSIGSSIEAVVAPHAKLNDTVKAFNSSLQASLFDSDQMLHIEKKNGKLEHEQIHSKAGVSDDKQDAPTRGLAQSSIKASIGLTEDSYKVVSELGNSDDCDMKAKTDVLSKEHGFVQIAHEFSQSAEKTEPQNGGHNQMPINELDLVASKCTEAERSLQLQVYNASDLHPPLAETSVHVTLSCPTIAALGVDKGLIDIKSSDLFSPKASVNEGVESNPRQKRLGVQATDNVNVVEEEEIGMIHKDEVMAQIEAAPK